MGDGKPVVWCILCERPITPYEAVWIADDESTLDSRNHPLSIIPICADCHLEIEMLADESEYRYVRSISRLN